MDSEELLAQLADIHLPAEISYWPPAFGWWILALLLLISGSFATRKLYEKAERRKACQYALAELENCLEKLDESAAQKKLLRYVNDVNTVLRRVALAKFPESNPGSLVGETWIAFIRRTGNSSQLDDKLSAALSHGRFRKQIEVDSQALNQMARSWILSVYQKETTPSTRLNLTEGSHQ
tara:strand:+ start:101 stop:637 length:537 start_codon:yes stop_codon:yes gene_type:complete